MTGGGPKSKAREQQRLRDLVRRDNELRAGDDAFNEAANLLTKRGAKKRRRKGAKARKH